MTGPDDRAPMIGPDDWAPMIGHRVIGRMLVAGVGNIFLGDDGFGVEVANRLTKLDLPDWVAVGDYGISGMHLAYDLADGVRTAILVDAAPRGGEPGTVYVIEPEWQAKRTAAGQVIAGQVIAGQVIAGQVIAGQVIAGQVIAEQIIAEQAAAGSPITSPAAAFFDAHGMQPDIVLGMLDTLGGEVSRVLIVGCEPASVDYGIGLSPPVAAAVDNAVKVVLELIGKESHGEQGAESHGEHGERRERREQPN